MESSRHKKQLNTIKTSKYEQKSLRINLSIAPIVSIAPDMYTTVNYNGSFPESTPKT